MLGKTLRTLLAIAGALVSVSASAVMNPCSFPFTLSYSPARPGPKDVVYADIDWPFTYLYSSYQTYLRTNVTATEVSVDIVWFAGSDPSFLTTAGFATAKSVPSYGIVTLGTLAAGTYAVRLALSTSEGNGQTLVPVCGGPSTGSLVVSAQSAPVQTAPVVEYYNPVIDHYFVTQATPEIAALDAGVFSGWVRTGQTFRAYMPGQSDNRGRTVCRWYAIADHRATHFFSASWEECEVLIFGYNSMWQEETNNAFEIALPARPSGVCPQNTVPVYRLWNARTDSDHRYTTDAATRDAMVAKGYVAEGYGDNAVAMCAPSQ